MNSQPLTPFIYEVVDAPTPQTTIVEFLLGTLGVVAAIAGVAVVFGLGFAAVLISLRRRGGQDPLKGQGRDSIRLGLSTPLRSTVDSTDGKATIPDAAAGGLS